ncbi:LysR family transcriptional regulator [Solimicrobium silvestre]|uniref:Transcriptional regulator n=1 Tax=Solimicrobium silvestre TaxID=2099400 RepID=A0A2S9GUY4_9BURK|nr:LysR family transcriptional regulator [Solimicrobium silvestre]PRC91537.1 Transcriptional regulator [Solimicrobium silvestre]
MAAFPHITLEQWRALITVVDTGSYANAAEALHKSQSSVTYAVQKLESLLGISAFEIQGRKAVLTPTGQLLYRRALHLLAEAENIERAAKKISAGWEPEIRLAADIIFPSFILLDCFDQFGKKSPHTRIELIESVMGGTIEALLTGQVDLAIATSIPQGFLGRTLIQLRFIPVAHPNHPLHQLNRELSIRDLETERHLVIRESGSKRTTNTLIAQAPQRWTVGHSATSIEAVARGYGFAWFPEVNIRHQLKEGTLKALPLKDGGERFATMYLIFADPDVAGPGTQYLAQLIQDAVLSTCAEHVANKG